MVVNPRDAVKALPRLAFQLAQQARALGESPRRSDRLEVSSMKRAAFALAGAGAGKELMDSVAIQKKLNARLTSQIEAGRLARGWMTQSKAAVDVSRESLEKISLLCLG